MHSRNLKLPESCLIDPTSREKIRIAMTSQRERSHRYRLRSLLVRLVSGESSSEELEKQIRMSHIFANPPRVAR
jgi:hypothetical protein